MRIVLAGSSAEDLAGIGEQICEWRYASVPWGIEAPESCFAEHQHWLGSSRDGRVWALAVSFDAFKQDSPKLGSTVGKIPLEIIAFLLDPPKRDVDTITKILLRTHMASVDNQVNPTLIDKIVRAVPFPQWCEVASYLPQAPNDWLELPAELLVNFQLSEGGAVGESTFKEYARDSLKDALQVVCGPRVWNILIGYTLAAREVTPLLVWEVDWPLSRRGDSPPTKRGKVQGDLPWESHTDTSLLGIYQYLPKNPNELGPHPYHHPIVRLRVGGRTSEEATVNWHQCARELRRLKKAFRLSTPAASTRPS